MKNHSVERRPKPMTGQGIGGWEAPLVGIVDDDEAVRDSISSLVRSVGLRAIAFSSAGGFLCSNRMHDSDCLILDVHMPGVSGVDLQGRLAAMGLPIPVIFASAYSDNGVRTRALDQGAVAFLCKPFTDEAFFDAIYTALGMTCESP